MVIAIDGPAGSGKSTTAKLLANKLNFIYLDSGAMYRAVTLYFLRESIDINDRDIISENLDNLNLSIDFVNQFEVSINGFNVMDEIRSNEIDALVSSVSKIDIVRKKMVDIQRIFSKDKNVVVEGRDIGSHVFPDAAFKFFLVADIAERAKRRLTQIGASDSLKITQLIENLEKRDKIDSSRSISPLIKSGDAIEIDTTNLTIEEQVSKIYKIINN